MCIGIHPTTNAEIEIEETSGAVGRTGTERVENAKKKNNQVQRGPFTCARGRRSVWAARFKQLSLARPYTFFHAAEILSVTRVEMRKNVTAKMRCTVKDAFRQTLRNCYNYFLNNNCCDGTYDESEFF